MSAPLPVHPLASRSLSIPRYPRALGGGFIHPLLLMTVACLRLAHIVALARLASTQNALRDRGRFFWPLYEGGCVSGSRGRWRGRSGPSLPEVAAASASRTVARGVGARAGTEPPGATAFCTPSRRRGRHALAVLCPSPNAKARMACRGYPVPSYTRPSRLSSIWTPGHAALPPLSGRWRSSRAT